jgi:hypothetical protein
MKDALRVRLCLKLKTLSGLYAIIKVYRELQDHKQDDYQHIDNALILL